MKSDYMGIERFIFADTYNLYIKYKDIKESDDNSWDKLIEDCRALSMKYKEYPLAVNIITAVVSQIEFRSTGKLIKGLTYDEWNKLLENKK